MITNVAPAPGERRQQSINSALLYMVGAIINELERRSQAPRPPHPPPAELDK